MMRRESPVVGSQSYGGGPFRHGSLVDRRSYPRSVELRAAERLLACCQVRIRQDHHRHPESFGDSARREDGIEAVLDRRRRHHDLRCVSVRREDGLQEVALFDFRGQARAGTTPLDVYDNERHLRHCREAKQFGLQRHARAGRDRHGTFAGVSGADSKTAGGDFVFSLMNDSADLFEDLRQIMRRGSRRRDGIHRADVHPRGHDAERQGQIPVKNDLWLRIGRRGHFVPEIQVLHRPLVSGIQKLHIVADDLLALLAKLVSDLVARHLELPRIDAAEHPKYEHVLPALRIGDVLEAFFLHRDFDDAKTLVNETIEGREVFLPDGWIGVVSPHVLEQDGRAGPEFLKVETSEQRLFVERDDQIDFIAQVCDGLRSEPNADAACACSVSRRWLNFSGYDLDRPDAVSHLGRNRSESLARCLRALPCITYDLHDYVAADLRRDTVEDRRSGCGQGLRVIRFLI